MKPKDGSIVPRNWTAAYERNGAVLKWTGPWDVMSAKLKKLCRWIPRGGMCGVNVVALLAVVLSVCLPAQAQSPSDERWDHAVIASQVFLATGAGAQIAAQTTSRAEAPRSQAINYVALVGTGITLQTIMLKRSGWKWKAAAIVANVGVGVALAKYAHDDVGRARRRLGLAQ